MTHPQIRQLTAEDAPAYWTLRYEALCAEPQAFGTAAEDFRDSSVAATAELLTGGLPSNFTLGAFAGDTLIAIAGFARETGLKERHKGYLRSVYVTAAHRHRGLARRLLETLLQKAAADPSLEQILLSVAHSQTPATQLYRQLGFTAFGTEPHALKVGSAYIDEDHMILLLHPPG